MMWKAKLLADLSECFAHHGLVHSTVACCIDEHANLDFDISSLWSKVRRSAFERSRSGCQRSCEAGNKSIRPSSDVNSDAGFELAGADLVLRQEIWPVGPYLQRITIVIASFSAISARIGLKMRAFALRVHADARSHTEAGRRSVEYTSGGQQASNRTSGHTLLGRAAAPRKWRHHAANKAG